ncbi:helix turn helix XRE family domain protein [Erwinia phage vB_EamM_RisingSun]|uniref:Helix turn helix XRE family domain protein n=1 Tax=Erwinia phage vB_EamM_RisingSun TaxID=2026080 RepID=A0A223LHN3_9CAUD|nr:HTH DNA binding protein [Erwinia phage vB_EamM_RisingSun]ASU03490.1 helix turn helix XRE family domain protein [Erwinia phage vB_EamM_RisingSun]
MSRKLKSVESVTRFALTRLSSMLYRLHKEKTMKEIAERAGVSASVLSSIKNDTIKSIALPRVLRIIENLNVEYTMNISNRAGIKYYSFEMEGYGHFGRSDKDTVEVREPGKKLPKHIPSTVRYN